MIFFRNVLFFLAAFWFAGCCGFVCGANRPSADRASTGHLDFDRDRIPNLQDRDLDGDNRANAFDPDLDGDGVLNSLDPEPYDPREDGNPNGVFVQFFREDLYDRAMIDRACRLISQAGIKWVFVNFFWDRVETQPGVFRFDLSDHIVKTALKYNLRLGVMLAYSTRWASSAPAGSSQRDMFVYPPKRYDDFANYVGKVVNRYKNQVKYWQIWGEPNMPDNWKPTPSAVDYARLLEVSFKAAKQADPSCRVVLGSLGGKMDLFLDALCLAGARDFFDVVAINPYANPLVHQDMFYTLADTPKNIVYEKINRVRQVMECYDMLDKPLWITEIGCPGQEHEGSWWFMGKTPGLEEQARWAGFVFEELVNHKGVDRVFWYNFRTTHDEKNAQAGLVHNNFSIKPAYAKVKKVVGGKRSAAAGPADLNY